MNFTLRNNTTFPDGTTVGVYNAYAFPFEGSGPPQATQITSDVMTDGEAVFSGLDPDTTYTAAAQIGGVWRRTSFRTDPVGPSQGSFDASDNITFAGDVGFTGGLDLTGADLLVPLASQADFDAHKNATASVHGIPNTAALLDTSKIGVSIAAQGDSRFPSAAQLAALAGTAGTPGGSNRVVTDQDPRLPIVAIVQALAAAIGTPGSGNPFVLDDDPRFTSATVRSVADNYTLADGDEGCSLGTNNNNNPKIWTVPHSTVWNPIIGTVVKGRNMGSQPLSIVAGTTGGTPIIRSDGGVLTVSDQFAAFFLEKIAANTWFLGGNIG
jgi:hypothetical protein